MGGGAEVGGGVGNKVKGQVGGVTVPWSSVADDSLK
jgi:hypothetical protein